MVLTLINLMQAQAAKVSWFLWAAAGLFFLAGLALLIYLITSSKKTDQSDDLDEEDGGGLLSKDKFSDETDEKKSPAQEVSAPVKEEVADASQTIPLFSEADFSPKPVHQSAPVESEIPTIVEKQISSPSLPQESPEEASQPKQTFSEPKAESTSAVDLSVAQQNLAPEIQEAVTTDEISVNQDSDTQILTSQGAAPTVEQTSIPAVISEEEIYSPQEEALFWQKEASFAQEPSNLTEHSTIALTSLTAEDSSARLDAPASQQRLEQSVAPRREPFEPPTIEPLAPKQTATQELSSQTHLSAVDEQRDARTTTLSSQTSQKQTVISPSAEVFSAPSTPAPADSGTIPLSSAQTNFTSVPQTKPQSAPQWEAQGAGTRSIERKPAGSILGLPAEASNAPLIIGQPLHPREDESIAALSNYGKDLDAAETGRGGAITLLIAILLIAGAVLVYFYVPAVRSRTDALVARIRGQQPAVAPVEKPKAQIYPSLSPEVNKNLVKARGAIMNISEETLEDLSVEVSLDRGEGTTAEVRTVAVKPNVLAPRQQGIYEFEYEGGKTTGFSRYRVTKLLGKNGEVKFKTPNQ
jgi:hypothetical protein